MSERRGRPAVCAWTPPCAGCFFGNNFTFALFACRKRCGCRPTNHMKPPPGGFGGAVRRSRAFTKKNMPFCAFFHVQPKHQNNAIFVNIEGLRPCLSKPSYGASQWALMARLMQKERPKSPQESAISEKTRPFGSFGSSFLVKHAIFAILATHFRGRMMDLPKKVPLRTRFKSARRS